MALYDFKPKYYTASGVDVDNLNNVVKKYVSCINYGGDGSSRNPYKVLPSSNLTDNNIIIYSNGVHKVTPYTTRMHLSPGYGCYFIGQDRTATVLNLKIGFYGQNGAFYAYFKDARIDFLQVESLWGANQQRIIEAFNCEIKVPLTIISPAVTTFNCRRSLIHFPNSNVSDKGQNSYINTDIVNIINSLALYDNCNVTLDTQARLNTYLNTYAAFNDCKFKIGNELDWTLLSGSTEAELRADFVARCEAQGFIVPTNTEFGDINIPMYRWVFATDSAKNGVPVRDGIIHNFEKRRFITFGYETKRDGFVISTDTTTKDSLNTDAPNDNLEFSDNALTFLSNVDTTDQVVANAQSNIKWLGGKYKLTALDIIHNMPVDFGIMVDNTPTIDFTPVNSGSIAEDELYIVRSSDKEFAQISYNSETFDSSVSNNNYIFRGVAGVTNFTITQGNAVIYKVTDFVQHQTLELRIVNKLPSEIITSGNLLENYWYFVEHDTDQSNATDYIRYNDKHYYSGSSFLVQGGNVSFSITGNIHLRRAWIDSFDFDTETKDKAHWQNEQKPKWCKLAIGDTPRCFMKSNSDRENEMKSDENGEYMTTGHPDFYKKENGDGGVVIPSFLIQGTYLQIRLTATTLNPM